MLRTLAAALLVVLPSVGCSTSSSTDASALDSGQDGNHPNACVAAGNGYACQSVCGAGTVNIEDLPCGSGLLCCGPIGEAGLDASDDVTVLVDSAVFETGPVDAGRDAGHDAGKDATTPEDAVGDATHDAPREAAPVTDGAGDGREPTDAATDVHHG